MSDSRPVGASTPDFTDSVMARLGYRRVTAAAELRAIRVRRVSVLALQGSVVLAACALGAAWWFNRARPERDQPAVGDALRGSLVQGAGRLDSILLGMPRVPTRSAVASDDATRVADAPARTADGAHAVRTY